jgi:hypothetical protein
MTGSGAQVARQGRGHREVVPPAGAGDRRLERGGVGHDPRPFELRDDLAGRSVEREDARAVDRRLVGIDTVLGRHLSRCSGDLPVIAGRSRSQSGGRRFRGIPLPACRRAPRGAVRSGGPSTARPGRATRRRGSRWPRTGLPRPGRAARPLGPEDSGSLLAARRPAPSVLRPGPAGLHQGPLPPSRSACRSGGLTRSNSYTSGPEPGPASNAFGRSPPPKPIRNRPPRNS